MSALTRTDSGYLADDYFGLETEDSFSLSGRNIDAVSSKLDFSSSDSFGSSDAIDEEDSVIKDSPSVSEIIPSSSSSSSSKPHVSFNNAVNFRLVYYTNSNSSEEEDETETEESDDSVIELKKPDCSRPVVENIQLSDEEEAIRKRLDGVIPATRRLRPNFAAMYGCGRSISNDDSDDEMLDDEDDDCDFDHPARVIVCQIVTC